jgi:hypothetical protein
MADGCPVFFVILFVSKKKYTGFDCFIDRNHFRSFSPYCSEAVQTGNLVFKTG